VIRRDEARGRDIMLDPWHRDHPAQSGNGVGVYPTRSSRGRAWTGFTRLAAPRGPGAAHSQSHVREPAESRRAQCARRSATFAKRRSPTPAACAAAAPVSGAPRACLGSPPATSLHSRARSPVAVPRCRVSRSS
jgi:hypothetical protein